MLPKGKVDYTRRTLGNHKGSPRVHCKGEPKTDYLWNQITTGAVLILILRQQFEHGRAPKLRSKHAKLYSLIEPRTFVSKNIAM